MGRNEDMIWIKKGIPTIVMCLVLDIGTRSVVGVVGYLEYGRFKIAAMAQQLHTTRAMLDGQIHDIYKVVIQYVRLSLHLKGSLIWNLKMYV